MARKKKIRKKDRKEKKEKKPSLSPETRSSVLVIVFLALGALSILAFLDRAGLAGQGFRQGAEFLFGKAAFLVPIFFLGAAAAALVTFHKKRHIHLYIGLSLVVLSILGFFEVLMQGSRTGGIVGYGITVPLLKFMSLGAASIVLGAAFLIGLLVAFDVSLRRVRQEIEVEDKPVPEPEPEAQVEMPEEASKKPEPAGLPSQAAASLKAGSVLGGLKERLFKAKAAVPKQAGSSRAPRLESRSEALPKVDKSYRPPPLELLDSGGGVPSTGDIKANQNIIKRTLAEFGIEAEMKDVNVGPSVTQYTLKPERGVRLERITALQRNLSLALAAHPIRIEAPIPGKSLVGFELPNKSSSIVRLRHVLEVLLENPPSSLAFSLGRDVRGQPVFADLAKLPHLLIAGATGSGKSIAINNIIITLTYLNSPRSLRFILIDPKRVELTPYNGIPHLLTPVVSQAQKAINALKWAIAEMEARYETLAQIGARDIASFNSQVKKRPDFEYLPCIVIMIDELADLMASHKREMEAVVVRLAQMARAVGIHLIASTQRPSTDVVTGLIKANITSRIAFKVASQVDSRTILDVAGAEKLLGSGDMLYMSTELQGLKRIQGTYVSEKEVQRVAKYLRDLAEEVDYEDDVVEEPRRQAGIGIAKGEPVINDELYEEAKRVVIEAGKGSSSLLQRRLRIGYSRAASLLDALEAQGIVGPAQGAKPRKVLVEKEERGL